MQNEHISIVTPVYGCGCALNQLYDRLKATLARITENYEIIMVNDGSPDDAWDVIQGLAKHDDRVKGVNLSRNFGQHEAITAGLHEANGEWVIVMDCDLQDRPEEILRLYNKASEGFDVVYARRHERMDSWLKKASSRLFYKVLGYLTDTNMDSTIGNFGIYNRKVIRAVLSMSEMLRYFPLMVRWVGFESAGIDVEHSGRGSGKTSYSLRKLVSLAVGVMVSFSDKPLRIIVQLGFWMSLMSALYATYIIWKSLMGGVAVQGWASVMVSLWFIGGLVMMMMGVVGVYVGKAFDEAKRRPAYIIDQRTSEK